MAMILWELILYHLEHEKTTIILGRLVERQVELSPFGQVAERHL